MRSNLDALENIIASAYLWGYIPELYRAWDQIFDFRNFVS